jgi:hypothetical protein
MTTDQECSPRELQAAKEVCETIQVVRTAIRRSLGPDELTPELERAVVIALTIRKLCKAVDQLTATAENLL